MATVPIPPDKVERIIADWRTGEYSQSEIAWRHKVSKGLVNKHVKGILQDMTEVVNAGVKYRQGLAEHDDRIVTAVTEVVDERTKHLTFFNKAGLVLAQAAVKRVQADPTIPMQDMRHASEVVAKQREGILGKPVDTQINIQNNQTAMLDAAALRSMPIERQTILRELLQEVGK